MWGQCEGTSGSSDEVCFSARICSLCQRMIWRLACRKEIHQTGLNKLRVKSVNMIQDPWSKIQDPRSMILSHIFWQSGDENMEQSTKVVWKQQGNQELLKYIQNPEHPMILSCSFFVPLHKLQWSLGLQSFLQLVTMVPSAPRFLWFILVVGFQPLVGQEGGWDCSGHGGKHLEEGEGQGGCTMCIAHCTRFFLVYSVNALSVLHQRHVWYQLTSRIT